MKKKMLRFIIAIAVIFLVISIVLPPSSGQLPKTHVLSEKTSLEVDGAQIGFLLPLTSCRIFFQMLIFSEKNFLSPLHSIQTATGTKKDLMITRQVFLYRRLLIFY